MTDEARLTAKQDKFVDHYHEFGNATEAYETAYPGTKMSHKSCIKAAKGLLKNWKVQARLQELYARHRRRHDISVDTLTTELEEARLAAMKAGQTNAAVSAILGKAKLHGLLTEDRSNKRKPYEDMPDDERRDRIDELSEKLGGNRTFTASGTGVGGAGKGKPH